MIFENPLISDIVFRLAHVYEQVMPRTAISRRHMQLQSMTSCVESGWVFQPPGLAMQGR